MSKVANTSHHIHWSILDGPLADADDSVEIERQSKVCWTVENELQGAAARKKAKASQNGEAMESVRVRHGLELEEVNGIGFKLQNRRT